MSDQEAQLAANKAIIERHFRAFDEKDYDLMESVTAPGMVHHATTLLPTRTGESTRRPRGAMRDPYLYLLAAFPDISFEIDRLVGEGDRVVARVHQRGTQRFKFQGLPPSDREVYVQQIHMFRIEDGKTTERWVARQDLRMLEQLGVVEATGSPDLDDSDGIDVPARSGDAGTRSGNEPSAVDRKAIVRSILEASYRPIHKNEPLPSEDPPSGRQTVSFSGPGLGAPPLPFGPRDDTLPFLRAAFPDLTMSEESLVSDGDHVAVLVRVQGTNTRAAHGFEPTRRAIDLHHIHVFQVSDSGASRWWPGRDDLALLIQLGVFVPPDRSEQVGWLHGEGGSTSGGADRGAGTTTIERTAQGE